jgi:membrane-bound lytic murein transglycosylase A
MLALAESGCAKRLHLAGSSQGVRLSEGRVWVAASVGTSALRLAAGSASCEGVAWGNSPFLRPENMVHQTIRMKMHKASNASSKIKPMQLPLFGPCQPRRVSLLMAAIVGMLSACSVAPVVQAPVSTSPSERVAGTLPQLPQDLGPLPAPILQAQSRWVPVRWSELPGLEQDAIQEAWPAWLQSCQRPGATWKALCPQVAKLAHASADAQRRWLYAHLQPYRVEALDQRGQGLLTGYYEPALTGSRRPQGAFQVPLYAPPAAVHQGQVWFSRKDMDTLPRARAALRGKELLYLADPVDAMVLHIQGSGLVQVTEADGRQQWVRMAYAGTNNQPYKSIGRWLLDNNLVRDASWPGIKAWIDRNPSRVNELLWQNPRVVFFKEEALPPGVTPPGPKGAQGVPLTAERSIAVDRRSIPYGTPVWLQSSGPQTTLQRLVMAQDTGTAIVGAVRADYYAGSGPAAGELAGRLKQPLQLWALWPK